MIIIAVRKHISRIHATKTTTTIKKQTNKKTKQNKAKKEAKHLVVSNLFSHITFFAVHVKL